MPQYEYRCEACKRDVTITMTIREHDAGKPVCPICGGKDLRPLIGAFFAKTSRKS